MSSFLCCHVRRTRAHFFIAASLCWLIPAFAQLNSAPLTSDHIVAIVNAEPITRTELLYQAERTHAQLQQQGLQVPAREALLKQELERLINEKTQLHLARETGIRVDEASLMAALQALAKQKELSLTAFRSQVQREGQSWERFRQELRNSLTLQRLRERDVERAVRVSDAELDAFAKNRFAKADNSSTNAEEEINLAQILLAVPERATEMEKQRLRDLAQTIYQAALAGQDFAQLAQTHSNSPEARAGGVMGLRSSNRYPEIFMQAVQALNAPNIAAPFESGAGWHILKVLERPKASADVLSVQQTLSRHILLRLDPKQDASATLARLAELRVRTLAGADFAALARQNSQDGSASEGGILGWANPGMFVPEFEEVMQKLQANEISQPFRSRFGVHLLQVLERRSAKVGPAELRDMVRGELREKKAQEYLLRWVQDVRGNAYVEYRNSGLL